MEDETIPNYRKRQLEYLAMKYKKLSDEQYRERKEAWENNPHKTKVLNSQGETVYQYSDKYRHNWSNPTKKEKEGLVKFKESEKKALKNFYKNNKLPFSGTK